jgi:endoglucanase
MTRRATVLLGGTLIGAVLVVVLVIALLGRGTGEGDPVRPVAASTPSTPAPSPVATDDSCAAQLTVTGTWPGGFGAELVVTTATTAPDWRLSWTLSDGSTVTEAWGATLVSGGVDGVPVQVTAPDWATDLSAGQSATVGFNGERTGDATPTLVGATLNGAACGGQLPTADPTTAPSSATGFYVDPDTVAGQAAQAASGADRAVFERIADTPQAHWVLDPDPTAAAQDVAAYTGAAVAAGKTGVLVIYAIPGRDCGAHSAGGSTEDGYRSWIAAVADAITGAPWVVLEPDALAQVGDCDGQGDRVGMLRDAAAQLDAAGARVYLDAGHARWLSADEAAARITEVGTEHLTGFALNVSNHVGTEESVRYGEAVSQATGDLGYVIDTSRNGSGSDSDEWCNVRGRSLGEDPRLIDDDTALDAVLWIKHPGESDGTCNGGPEAGQWWPEIARELVGGAGAE